MTDQAQAAAAIRTAVPADAGPMAQVFVRAWRQAYPGVVPAAVLGALDLDQTTCWLAGLIADGADGQTDVAEQDGRVTGFVRYGLAKDVPAGEGQPPGHVFGLYVDPAAAGRGTGQALLRHAELRLRARGCAHVSLYVFEANERARRLYTKAGYQPDGTSRVEAAYQANEVRLVKALP
jgi:ribosomal protein S18 acetylase RimI-like enzyme